MTLGLTAKIVRVHRALDRAELPHAFGGALALAFCTAEPRATIDVDVNVFVGVDRLPELVRALPKPIEVSETARVRLGQDAQARLWWERTPVDIFLSNHPFHDRAEANRHVVPFAGVDLPVLGCVELAVFKTFFARPKDVVDVATMIAAGAVPLDELRRLVDDLLGVRGDRDAFFDRVADALAQLN